MVKIFFFCTIVSFTLVVYGNLLLDLLKKKFNSEDNYSESGLFGIIFTSFIGLFGNFFFPINTIFCNLVLLGAISYYFLKKNFNKNFIYIILLSSFFSTLLITLNNVNRPDAGLYHLPYISILNKEKIIIGLSNLDLRFGHTSIIQYVSAIFRNSILGDNGTTIPLALSATFFLIYITEQLFFYLKKKTISILIIFLFLILIFSLNGFSNYSSYGNDVPSYIYFFFTIITYINSNTQNKEIDYHDKKIVLSSIFVIFNKLFFIFILMIPALIILKKYKDILKKKFFFLLITFFLILWFLKNILISSCILYPVKITCLKNLSWFNNQQIYTTEIQSEAWAKGWIDQDEPKLDFIEYNKNFNWFKTWQKKHLNKIIEKFSFFIVFNIIFILILLVKYKKNNIHVFRSKHDHNKIKLILTLNTIGVIFWFLKFPLYRFGTSYLVSFVSINSTLIIYFFSKIKNLNKNLIKNLIYFGFFLFISINLKRIVNNYNDVYNQYPWPRIYAFTFDNIPEEKIPVKYNEKIIYYKSKNECMYTLYSPCTQQENVINYKEFNSYKIFF
jgi:hypothetical protein